MWDVSMHSRLCAWMMRIQLLKRNRNSVRLIMVIPTKEGDRVV